jgi:hypothetical protein
LKTQEKIAMAMEFMKRVTSILKQEKIAYEPAAVAKLVESYFPDYRRILGEIQKFSKYGAIDAGVIAQISDIRKMNELIEALKNGNFSDMRKWVVTNADVDQSRVYRKIYDSLSDHLKPESIPQAVVIISKYQYQSSFVADQEINLVACLTEMMVDCEYN